jgi:hypothetical protein
VKRRENPLYFASPQNPPKGDLPSQLPPAGDRGGERGTRSLFAILQKPHLSKSPPPGDLGGL